MYLYKNKKENIVCSYCKNSNYIDYKYTLTIRPNINKISYKKETNENKYNEITLIKKDINEIGINSTYINNLSLIVDRKIEKIGYLYIIKEREFLKTNENIYKVGCTENINKRVSQYPKGSLILFLLAIFNFRNIEKLWIKQLNDIKEIKNRKDIGREYFEGDYLIMINKLINILSS